MKAICIVLLVLSLLAACAGVQASIIYKFTFDVPASSPGPSPYVPAPNEILPSGISSIRLENITDIAEPSVSGSEGGNVLSQPLGGAWLNTQGYRFGADGTQYIGTPGPVIANAWTIEAIVKPDFSGCQYGMTSQSNIIDSEQLGDGTPWGDVALYVDQNTGMVTFAPSGQSIGVIQSKARLQSGQWYHIAAVVRPGAGQQTELWIDGALDSVGGYPTGWETQDLFKIPGYFNIGSCYWPVNAKNWQGQIDALAISDTALNAGNFVFNGCWWNRPYVNVKDYGAKGDGVTDDTAAIRAAMDIAGSRSIVQNDPNYGYYISNAVLFFPAGKYVISDVITLKADVMGEGTAILYQNNPAKDILYSSSAWRNTISGMSFVGGLNQINVSTNNVDTSRVAIEKCHFYYAADCAVTTPLSPSTLVTIKDSVFMYCNQAFANYCTMSSIEDSWITSSKNMVNNAVIENPTDGVLLAENIYGDPEVTAGNDQRWIDNNFAVTCRDFLFGGVDGGFTPVVNYAVYGYTYPIFPSTVNLDACDIYATGNTARQCAIYCEEIPNCLVYKNCRGFTDIPVLAFRPTIDFNTYFDNAGQLSPKSLRFLPEKDNVEVSSTNLDLPEQMRPFQATYSVEADVVPTTGWSRVGTFILNRACVGGFSPWGWICTVAGEPGTWKGVYPTITLWSDGFESGNFTAGGWTNSGCTIQSTYKYSGTYAAQFNSIDMLTKAYSTVGKSCISVRYARYTRAMESDDHFISEWYNGSAWTTMEDLTGNSAWTVKQYQLPAGAENNASFKIRFKTVHNGSTDYAYLDDVKIIGL